MFNFKHNAVEFVICIGVRGIAGIIGIGFNHFPGSLVTG